MPRTRKRNFGHALAQTLQTHGRLFEPELLVRYYARVLDVVGLIGMVPLGIKMLLKEDTVATRAGKTPRK